MITYFVICGSVVAIFCLILIYMHIRAAYRGNGIPEFED